MLKKITFMLILTVLLCLGMSSVAVYAATVSLTKESVETYKNDTNDYEITGDTYELAEDLTFEDPSSILLIAGPNGIVIDLNGHTMKFAHEASRIYMYNEDVTIKDSKGTGKIEFVKGYDKGLYIDNFDASKKYKLFIDSVNFYGNIITGARDESVITIKDSKIYSNFEDPKQNFQSVVVRYSKLIIDNSYIYGGVKLSGDMDFISGQIGEEGSERDSLLIIREKYSDDTDYSSCKVTFGKPDGQTDADVFVAGNRYMNTWAFDELTINHLQYGSEVMNDQAFSMDMYALDPDKLEINSFTYYGSSCNLIVLKNKLNSYGDLYGTPKEGYLNKDEAREYLKKLFAGKKIFGDVEYKDKYTSVPYVSFFQSLNANKGKAFRVGAEDGHEFTGFWDDAGGQPENPTNPEKPTKPTDEPVEATFVITGLDGVAVSFPSELIKKEDGSYSINYNKKTKVKLPNKKVMIRTGYEFAGWLDQNNKKVSTLNYKALGKLTSLTASWKANTYKIKYKLVYPEKGYKASEKIKDANKYLYDTTKVTILGEGVIASGKLDGAAVYRLKGWTTDKEKAVEGTAECMYLAGEKDLINLAGTTKKDKTLTLYPVWEKING